MKLSTPPLEFFSVLEQKASIPSLIDTNLFLPVFYDSNLVGLSKREFYDFVCNNCRTAEELREIKTLAREYAERYFRRLTEMIGRNSNIATIQRVLEECRMSRKVYLDSSRILRRKSRTEKEQLQRNLMLTVSSFDKTVANNIDRAINTLEARYVYKEGCAGRKELYNEIFSAVNRRSERLGMRTNELCTDQHLLTTAFYLSALGGTGINIFSRDNDFLRLLQETHHEIEQVSKHSLCSLPTVSIYRPGYCNNKFTILEFKINGRKPSSAEIIL